MKHRLFYLLLSFLFLSGPLYAQKQDLSAFPNIKMNVRIPTGLSNDAFKEFVNGVVDVDLSAQIPLYKSLTGGLGMKYNYNKAFEPSYLNDLETDDMHFMAPFLKVGYERFLGERLFMELAVNGGYKFMEFSAPRCEALDKAADHSREAVFVEPSLGFYVHAGDRMAFGASVTYDVTLYEFEPDMMCLDELSSTSITEDMTKGNLQFITFGFGFVVDLSKEPVKR